MKNNLIRQLQLMIILVACSSGTIYAQSKDSLINEISLGTEYYYFDWPVNNHWNIHSMEYKRAMKHGPVIGRVSYADRGMSDGAQFEIESYPRISKKVYSYMNLGFSPNSNVFPGFKAGASFYYNLPRGWELEGGGRLLHFNENVYVGIVGLGKYLGNYLFNARSFISANNGAVSQSYFLSARRYFGEKNNYVMLQLGTGTSPDENRNLLLKRSEVFSSKRINAMLNVFPGKHHKMILNLGYSREEFSPNIKSNLFQGSVVYGYRF